MPRPIKERPILRGEDAKRFMDEAQKNENKLPIHRQANREKLEEAVKKINWKPKTDKTTIMALITVEKGDDGTFAIYTSGINDTIVGEGDTLPEAKADFEEGLKLMIDCYQAKNLPADLQNLIVTLTQVGFIDAEIIIDSELKNNEEAQAEIKGILSGFKLSI